MRSTGRAVPLEKKGVCSLALMFSSCSVSAQSDWISPMSCWYCKLANDHKNVVTL